MGMEKKISECESTPREMDTGENPLPPLSEYIVTHPAEEKEKEEEDQFFHCTGQEEKAEKFYGRLSRKPLKPF